MIDETYRYGGERSEKTFEDNQEEQAVEAYHASRRGMASLLKLGEDGSKRLHTDETGRKYIKGSPFYDFPHVPHRSVVDGQEIPST